MPTDKYIRLNEQEAKRGYVLYRYLDGRSEEKGIDMLIHCPDTCKHSLTIVQQPESIYAFVADIAKGARVGDKVFYNPKLVEMVRDEWEQLDEVPNNNGFQRINKIVEPSAYMEDEQIRYTIKIWGVDGVAALEEETKKYIENKKDEEVENIVPDYYASHSIMPSDFIEDWDLNFNRGSAVKYCARAGDKIEPGLTHEQMLVKDLTKARTLIDREIRRIKRKYKMVD